MPIFNCLCGVKEKPKSLERLQISYMLGLVNPHTAAKHGLQILVDGLMVEGGLSHHLLS